MKLSFAILSVIAAAQAAYVPSDPWSTLTPSKTATDGITDYTSKFGILVQTLSRSTTANKAAATPVGKRDVVNQIGDGQIQNQKPKGGDNKPTPRAPAPAANNKPTPAPAPAGNPSGDNKGGNNAPRPAAGNVINQIGDGQIQNQKGDNKGGNNAPKPAAGKVINQIGDGQIQNQKGDNKGGNNAPKPAAGNVINQIGDGQIQNQKGDNKGDNKGKPAAGNSVKQIGDGQIQQQGGATASQIKDGQVQSKTGSGSYPYQCRKEDDTSLTMTLKGGILTDSQNRIGAIVANYQFQFDGPPQAGTIYAVGWSINPAGNLALGGDDLFYQCASGDFHNLYYFENSKDIQEQCAPVHLNVVDLITC